MREVRPALRPDDHQGEAERARLEQGLKLLVRMMVNGRLVYRPREDRLERPVRERSDRLRRVRRIRA